MNRAVRRPLWPGIAILAVIIAGLALSVFVYRTTTQIREALAEEALQQQRDVAALLHEYAALLLALERQRLAPSVLHGERLGEALPALFERLRILRSSYSFTRLEGAAGVHAFVKPVLEDVRDWLANGLPGYAQGAYTAGAVAAAAQRAAERMPKLRALATAADNTAAELVEAQARNLERFRNTLLGALGALAVVIVAVITLLTRQRDLQTRLLREQERHAKTLQVEALRRQLEESDRLHHAQLARVTRLTTVGELAAGLAHEINQPLTAISHNADAALSTVADGSSDAGGELSEIIEDIYEQAQRAGSIVRGLRRMVRKDAGGGAVDTDLNQLVEDTVRLTGPEARANGVLVRLKLGSDLPPAMVDPVLIQQVLVNLQRNSIDAIAQLGRGGELSITTRREGTGALQVSVSDDGPGILPELKARLFTPFQTSKDDGMGLGLSVSRSIVEANHGRLWFDDDSADGATFHFVLPTARRARLIANEALQIDG